ASPAGPAPSHPGTSRRRSPPGPVRLRQELWSRLRAPLLPRRPALPCPPDRPDRADRPDRPDRPAAGPTHTPRGDDDRPGELRRRAGRGDLARAAGCPRRAGRSPHPRPPRAPADRSGAPGGGLPVHLLPHPAGAAAPLAPGRRGAAGRWGGPSRVALVPGGRGGRGSPGVAGRAGVPGRPGRGVAWARELLARTLQRPGRYTCFGLHEWAMVYRTRQVRHQQVPLRLGAEGTDEVVRAHPLRCTHFDAFRFFTEDAVPRNERHLDRASQLELEQPGCLHANMDTYRVAMKLGPAVPGELLLDC